MARAKELNFFVERGSWAKGIDWYAAQFDGSAAVRGESSPAYTNSPFHEGVPARMHSLVPDAKLVFLVRDPLDRIVSQYVHDYSVGKEDRPIEQALADGISNHPYVVRSKYFFQLDQYLPYFAPETILVLAQEDLLHDRAATMQRVFEFLGVDSSFYHPNFEQIKHLSRDRRRRTWAGRALASGVRAATRPFHPPRWLAWQAENYLVFPFARKVPRPVLPPALRDRLVQELRDDANRLREVTGKEFPGWCV